MAKQAGSAPPDWAVVFVRKSTGRGVDSLVVEALARRVAGIVGVFEELQKKGRVIDPLVALGNAIEKAKKL